MRWIHEEFLTLAHEHTDIGDSLSTAELGKQSFEHYQTKKTVSVGRGWGRGGDEEEEGREEGGGDKREGMRRRRGKEEEMREGKG